MATVFRRFVAFFSSFFLYQRASAGLFFSEKWLLFPLGYGTLDKRYRYTRNRIKRKSHAVWDERLTIEPKGGTGVVGGGRNQKKSEL